MLIKFYLRLTAKGIGNFAIRGILLTEIHRLKIGQLADLRWLFHSAQHVNFRHKNSLKRIFLFSLIQENKAQKIYDAKLEWRKFPWSRNMSIISVNFKLSYFIFNSFSIVYNIVSYLTELHKNQIFKIGNLHFGLQHQLHKKTKQPFNQLRAGSPIAFQRYLSKQHMNHLQLFVFLLCILANISGEHR